MALANNLFELRSDSFKIAVHNRRPIPTRTDTIGPWLDELVFLIWLAALTNSSLVYLFSPAHPSQQKPLISPNNPGPGNMREGNTHEVGIVLSAVLIALAASHGFMLLRSLVGHVVERALWKGG